METFYIAILSFIGAGIGTVTGFGSSTVMLPVLLSFYPLPEALLLAGLVHIFNDVWQVLFFKDGLRWRLILEFGLIGALATFVGARLVFVIPESILNTALGLFFVAYVVFIFMHSKFKVKHRERTASIGGIVSGFFAGISGLGGAIRSAFLLAFNLPKEAYVSSIGAIALLTDGVRTAAYYMGGARLSDALLQGLILFIVMSFVGAKFAERFIHKISQDKFRAIVAVFLLGFGMKLIFF
ncbi:MAG: sulfite exporter TauE/SafE family protein [Candidatus Spechtbacterales bacterium]|nr:sulfite exporter TauE/SafE family protein [Candidatus Spechtbacterales bacterium]